LFKAERRFIAEQYPKGTLYVPFLMPAAHPHLPQNPANLISNVFPNE